MVLLHHFLDGPDGVAETVIAFQTGLGDDTGGFDVDESLLCQCGNILLNGVCTNSFVTGIALKSSAVFAVEQVRVDGDLAGR